MINADETLTGGYNLFEYCFNDPVNSVNLNGNRRADTNGPIGVYNTQHEAAIAFGRFINNESINNQWEYDGAIVRLPNGRYTFTFPETNESYGDCSENYIHRGFGSTAIYYGRYPEEGFYNSGNSCDIATKG